MAHGTSKCASCGSPAIVTRADSDQSAPCVNHPQRVASAPCSRCGTFCCATCLVVVEQTVRCRTCRPPPLPAIAWEDDSRLLVDRFLSTTFQFVASPMASASLVSKGSLPNALAYAGVVFALQAAAWALVIRFAKGTVVAAPLLCAVVAFVWLMVLPLGEYGCLLALGKKTPFSVLLASSAYATAPLAMPWCGLVGLLVLGPFVRLVTLRSAMALSWGQALLGVSLLPVIVACLVLVTRVDLLL